MTYTDSPTWDLESLLPGGLEGASYRDRMAGVEARLPDLIARADALGAPGEDPAWVDVVLDLEAAYVELGQPTAVLHCMAAADTTDGRAQRELGRASGLFSQWSRAWTWPQSQLARATEEQLQALLQHPDIAPFEPWFRNMRAGAHLLLPPAEESLLADLDDPAMGAWSRSYRRISGRLRVELGGEQLSPSQTYNLMDSPDADLRRRAFEATNAAWEAVEDDCAEVLSNLCRTRTVVADRLGVDALAKPLHGHRLQASTLDALIQACAEARPLMVRYGRAKAKLLGQERLHWRDLRAPVGAGSRTWTWAEGQRFVVEQMATFSQDMADYAADALARRHVESEDRGGKRAGAFCIGLHDAKESRVFMTWGGTTTNVLTLAHELGHAYHNHVMWDLHRARKRVPSTLAESASTFAEALVRGAAMQRATDDDERLALLDEDLNSASVMLCNIPVRYAFDRALYDLRRKGPLDPRDLRETMVSLQREWYGDALGEPDPMFWAAKMHFFLTRPFYNYPYTFGYLFSGLIWERAMAEGPAWAGAYRDLLRDTGAASCEEVALRHLGLDLHDPAAWSRATAGLEARVAEFERLAAR